MNDNEDPVAYFDMDGTLCDYSGALVKSMKELQSPDEPNIENVWDAMPKHLIARMELIKSHGEWWESLPVFPLGWDVLEQARVLKFRLVVLTQGPKTNPAAWSHKLKWCMVKLPNVDVCITRDKGLNFGRVLVDDYPDYAMRWLEHRPRGLVIMPAHSYNESFKHPNVVRYDGKNVEEVSRALSKARNRKDYEPLEL